MQDAARSALEVAEDAVAQPVGVSRVTVFAHFPGWKARGRPHRGRAQVRQPSGVILVLALLPVTDFAAGAGSRRNSEHPSAPKHPEEPSHQPGPTSGPQPWAGTATGIRAASQSAAQTAALGAVAKIGLPVTGVPAVSTGPRREVLDERLAGHKELRRAGRVLPGLRRAERPAAVVANVWPQATVQTSSVDTAGWRDGLAGHRTTGRGPMQTCAFEAQMQTCPSRWRRPA